MATAESIRLFAGSTELKYGACTIIKTSDHIVDSAMIDVVSEPTVIPGTLIDFKKVDGSTIIFTGQVNEKKREDLWKLKVLTNGYELNNIRVEQIYENKSPEFIVQDIIDTFTTNLTYASTTSSSGITLTKYVAKAYAIDIIRDMMDLLEWQLRVDESNNVYFESKGITDNGITFTNATNFQVTFWDEDLTTMFNRVKVRGGTVSYNTTDTDTGDDSTVIFNLSHKPIGSVKVTIDGTEQVPTVTSSLYVVDPDNKKITFATAPADGEALVFIYSFHLPIVVDYQNDESIALYGEIFREISTPFIDTFTDARKYAQSLLDVHSIPLVRCRGFEGTLNFDREVGEKVTVVDPVRDKTEVLVITKITIDAQNNKTTYEIGTREFIFYDWQREVQERVKKLEREIRDEDEEAFSRLFKHDMNIVLTNTTVFKFNFAVDTFIVGHTTLGRMRETLNVEADCSSNTNHGVWSGTDITGSQYDAAGWRLSAGQFNGTDNVITVTDDNTLDLTGSFSVAGAVRVGTLPGAENHILSKFDGMDGYVVRVNASDKVEMAYFSSGNPTSTITSSTALTAGDFQHFAFTKSGTALSCYIDGTLNNTATGQSGVGTNSSDLLIGKYSSDFFAGDLDEIRLYDDAITASVASDINSKLESTSNLVGWWSMDNPRLGDRTTPKLVSGGSGAFSLDLTSTDGDDSGSTAFWDSTLERLAMSSSSNRGVVYNTMILTKQIFMGGKNFDTATITSSEVLWGNDTIRYFLSADAGANWQEAFSGTSITFINQGNDIRVRIVFIGNGASSTYLTALQVAFTRTT